MRRKKVICQTPEKHVALNIGKKMMPFVSIFSKIVFVKHLKQMKIIIFYQILGADSSLVSLWNPRMGSPML